MSSVVEDGGGREVKGRGAREVGGGAEGRRGGRAEVEASGGVVDSGLSRFAKLGFACAVVPAAAAIPFVAAPCSPIPELGLHPSLPASPITSINLLLPLSIFCSIVRSSFPFPLSTLSPSFPHSLPPPSILLIQVTRGPTISYRIPATRSAARRSSSAA